MVMPLEKRPFVSTQGFLALGLGVLGACLYCAKTANSANLLVGVSFALLNLVLACTDRVIQRRLLTTECSNLSIETCMLLNNAVGVFPALLLAVYLGEFAVAKPQDWLMGVNIMLLLLSGVIGSGICYFGLAVQRQIT